MTLIYDYRVEAKAHHICHMIEQETGQPPSDKLRSDVFLTTRAAVNYWKEALDRELKKKNEYKLNELRRGIHRLRPDSHEDIVDLFEKVMKGKSVQEMKPYKKKEEFRAGPLDKPWYESRIVKIEEEK
jgi:hypothetical protein